MLRHYAVKVYESVEEEAAHVATLFTYQKTAALAENHFLNQIDPDTEVLGAVVDVSFDPKDLV